MNISVTGCSRGVGIETCRVLFRESNHVYGVARSYTEEIKELEQEYAGHLFFKSIDLADSEGFSKSIFKLKWLLSCYLRKLCLLQHRIPMWIMVLFNDKRCHLEQWGAVLCAVSSILSYLFLLVSLT